LISDQNTFTLFLVFDENKDDKNLLFQDGTAPNNVKTETSERLSIFHFRINSPHPESENMKLKETLKQINRNLLELGKKQVDQMAFLNAIGDLKILSIDSRSTVDGNRNKFRVNYDPEKQATISENGPKSSKMISLYGVEKSTENPVQKEDFQLIDNQGSFLAKYYKILRDKVPTDTKKLDEPDLFWILEGCISALADHLKLETRVQLDTKNRPLGLFLRRKMTGFGQINDNIPLFLHFRDFKKVPLVLPLEFQALSKEVHQKQVEFVLRDENHEEENDLLDEVHENEGKQDSLGDKTTFDWFLHFFCLEPENRGLIFAQMTQVLHTFLHFYGIEGLEYGLVGQFSYDTTNQWFHILKTEPDFKNGKIFLMKTGATPAEKKATILTVLHGKTENSEINYKQLVPLPTKNELKNAFVEEIVGIFAIFAGDVDLDPRLAINFAVSSLQPENGVKCQMYASRQSFSVDELHEKVEHEVVRGTNLSFTNFTFFQ